MSFQPDYDDINDDERMKAFRVKSDKGRDLNKKYGKLINWSNSRIGIAISHAKSLKSKF